MKKLVVYMAVLEIILRKFYKEEGIELPIRSKNAGKEPANKSTGKRYYCLNCGIDITNAKNTMHKFCSNKCQQEYNQKQWVSKYINKIILLLNLQNGDKFLNSYVTIFLISIKINVVYVAGEKLILIQILYL